MSQNRKAPAYQEYAASVMAKIAYRTMTLQERGLLHSMKNECWVNGRLPERPDLLSKVLGFPEQQITDSLPAVMPFFAVSDGFIFNPELEDYKKHIKDIRDAQSRGGKVGASLTNTKPRAKKSRMDSGDSSHPTSEAQVNPRVTRESTRESVVQLSTVQPSQEQFPVKELPRDEWLADYDAASNGSAYETINGRAKVRI